MNHTEARSVMEWRLSRIYKLPGKLAARRVIRLAAPDLYWLSSISMSAPWPDYPYYLPYPPGQLWAYNYPRLSPSFHDAPMRSAMVSGDGINGSPQSLPVANNFVSTMDLEAHHDAQTHHDAQSVGGSDSR